MNEKGTIYKPTTQTISVHTRTTGKIAALKPDRMQKIKKHIQAFAKHVSTTNVKETLNVRWSDPNLFRDQITKIGINIKTDNARTTNTKTWKLPFKNDNMIQMIKKNNFCRANGFATDDSNIAILEAEIITTSIMKKHPVMKPEQLISRYG
jgi:hypothetical protein